MRNQYRLQKYTFLSGLPTILIENLRNFDKLFLACHFDINTIIHSLLIPSFIPVKKWGYAKHCLARSHLEKCICLFFKVCFFVFISPEENERFAKQCLAKKHDDIYKAFALSGRNLLRYLPFTQGVALG